MTFSTFWVILFALLAVSVSFASGVFLGRFAVWRKLKSLSADGFNPQLLQFVRRLNGMIDQLSHDVGEHQSKIEASNSELASTQGESTHPITEFVVRVVGKILESNESLQHRLQSAEVKLREQREQLDSYLVKSQTDSLTRLPNRRTFDERLRISINNFETLRKPFALLMLDADRFKAVNDGFGHPGGDYVLRELGMILASFAAEGLFAARLGGEEFAVLADFETVEEAFVMAEKIRLAVAEHYFSYEGVALAVTMSGGLALIRDGESGSDLLGRTDQALYAAKAAGRNCCYYQNGKTCQPINLPRAPKEDGEAILELCDDLRQRMAEIAKQ